MVEKTDIDKIKRETIFLFLIILNMNNAPKSLFKHLIPWNKKKCLNLGDELLANSKLIKTCYFVVFLFLISPVYVYGSDDDRLDHLPIFVNSIDHTQAEMFLPELQDWDLEYLFRDNNTEKILNHDLWLAFKYVKENNFIANETNDVYEIFSFVELGDYVHRWDASLTWKGKEPATIIEQTDVLILENVKGRFLVYEKPNDKSTYVMLYWIKEIPFKKNVHIETMYVHLMIWSTTDYLSSIRLINEKTDFINTKELFHSFAIPIATHWNQDMSIQNDQDHGLLLTGLEKPRLNNHIIPYWIKMAALSWSNDLTSENDFIKGIQFLIQNQSLSKPQNESPHESNNIPNWFKHNVIWLMSDSISEREFLQTIQFLIDNNVIHSSIPISIDLPICTTNEIEQLLIESNRLVDEYNFLQAIDCFEKILKLDSTNIDALNGKANALVGLSAILDAFKIYTIVLQTDPDNIDAMLGLGNGFYKKGAYDEAKESYTIVLQTNPNNIDAMLGQAKIFLEMNNPTKSLILLNKILEIEPTNFHANYLKKNLTLH